MQRLALSDAPSSGGSRLRVRPALLMCWRCYGRISISPWASWEHHASATLVSIA